MRGGLILVGIGGMLVGLVKALRKRRYSDVVLLISICVLPPTLSFALGKGIATALSSLRNVPLLEKYGVELHVRILTVPIILMWIFLIIYLGISIYDDDKALSEYMTSHMTRGALWEKVVGSAQILAGAFSYYLFLSLERRSVSFLPFVAGIVLYFLGLVKFVFPGKQPEESRNTPNQAL